MKPKVSVITTVYNGEEFLKSAVQSVLNQTFKDFEYIVVNDKSTDSTREILESFNDPRLVIINNKDNLGTYHSANVALQTAKGEWIARLDSDDLCMPNRLEVQYNFAEKNKKYSIIGSNAEVIDENGNFLDSWIYPEEHEHIFADMFFRNPIIHSCAFFRKSAASVVGNYSNDRKAQDFKLWTDLLKNGFKFYNIQEHLVKRRVHSNNMTSTSNTYENDMSDQEVVARKIFFNLYSELLRMVAPHSQIRLMRRIVFYQNNNFTKKEKLLLLKFLSILDKRFIAAYPDQELIRHYLDLRIRSIVTKMFGRRLFRRAYHTLHNLYLKI